jgi:hypothetical protein
VKYSISLYRGTIRRSGLLFSSLFPVAGLQGIQVGSRRQNVATTGTKGSERAFRRAFDWQQRCRLR